MELCTQLIIRAYAFYHGLILIYESEQRYSTPVHAKSTAQFSLLNIQRFAQNMQAGQMSIQHGERQILHFQRNLIIIPRHTHH